MLYIAVAILICFAADSVAPAVSSRTVFTACSAGANCQIHVAVTCSLTSSKLNIDPLLSESRIDMIDSNSSRSEVNGRYSTAVACCNSYRDTTPHIMYHLYVRSDNITPSQPVVHVHHVVAKIHVVLIKTTNHNYKVHVHVYVLSIKHKSKYNYT